MPWTRSRNPSCPVPWSLVDGHAASSRADLQALRKADEINVEAGFMQASDLLQSYDNLATDEFAK